MKKVLVVDDTKNIRNMLSTCLELSGYEVLTAKNGNEALATFKMEKIDLAFLDIKLPEVSGTEVLRTIRSLGIHTPVVIMTAFATVKNAIECTKLEAVMYLQKPFTADKIKTVLEEIQQQNKSDESVQNYIKLAKMLIIENKMDDAYEELKNAMYIDPACGEAYYFMGVIADKRGNIEESLKFYNAAKSFGYKNE